MSDSKVKQAAVIGAGVIGAGWVGRFIENGIDVTVYDPGADAKIKLDAVLKNSRYAANKITMAPRRKEGRVILTSSLSEAVSDAQLIVESVPERLDIKLSTYSEIEKHAAKDALITSSTSGLLPTDLQSEMQYPERLLVAHPFNPVYLIPLVEIVGGGSTCQESIDKAMSFYRSLGMHPLHVKKEIEAFIADRLLEAVWRESLWLVKDGIATTQDIDDAIRFGFGLRWAQMGTFETYRIAGGEAGMRHFMAQFGPCLSWPWTKLMDVPEFNKELVDLVSTQSDEQSGAYSIRELERIRDDNLIGIMQSLKTNNWGAGQTLADYEKKLYDAELLSIDKVVEFSQQVRCFETTVPGDWADYNGHMTESRYLQCATHATDNFMAMIGADQAYINSGKSFFTVETHIRHLDEVAVLQNIFVDTQVLKAEGKKMHLYHRIQHDDGRLLATAEQMLIHVDLETRKASVPDVEVGTKLSKIAEQHAQLPYPEAAGKAIG